MSTTELIYRNTRISSKPNEIRIISPLREKPIESLFHNYPCSDVIPCRAYRRLP